MFCEYLRKQKQVTHEVRFKSELADVQDFPYILSSDVDENPSLTRAGLGN